MREAKLVQSRPYYSNGQEPTIHIGIAHYFYRAPARIIFIFFSPVKPYVGPPQIKLWVGGGWATDPAFRNNPAD